MRGSEQKLQDRQLPRATDAVQRRDWDAAARYFTQAAAALPPDPHGSVMATELILRRQAHVAGSMHRRMQYFGLERAFVIPDRADQRPEPTPKMGKWANSGTFAEDFRGYSAANSLAKELK